MTSCGSGTLISRKGDSLIDCGDVDVVATPGPQEPRAIDEANLQRPLGHLVKLAIRDDAGS